MKYVLVSGGVVSGLGKGITASSIGLLLKSSGLRVTSVKIDPYLNIDAGTMSPYEHGECFVLDDGGEADLDLGNYERFLDVTLTKDHNITTGKMYQHVIQRERRGDYLGKTVQVVPHVTDTIQAWIERAAQIPVDGQAGAPDVCMIELGGTVGDIESMVFLEALRQFHFRVGRDNFCHVHVSLVPLVGGEQKSKPIQHSVQTLRAVGLSPDILVCRCQQALLRGTVEKLSLFCMVLPSHVISVHDVSNIYQVPHLMLEKRVPSLVLSALHLNKMPPEALVRWQKFARRDGEYEHAVTIAIVGKYTGLTDSYLSVIRGLSHSAMNTDRRLVLNWVESSMLEPEVKLSHPDKHDAAWAAIKASDGILIPGGFGDRGVRGKIAACRYAREHKVPFFGICLGLQIAVIEYARHVLGWSDANSTEMDADTEHPVVVFMPEQSAGMDMGGTMRLGARASVVKSGTLAHQVYGFQSDVSERHRHRYEVNPECVAAFEAGVAATGDAAAIAGLVFSSTDVTKQRMEMVELPTDVHPFFFAVQFHPEFKSRPTAPSPPFLAFIQAAARVFVRRAAPSSLRSASPMAHSSEAGLGSDRASPMAGVVGIVDRVASGAASATAAFRTSGAALEDASAMKKAKF